MTIISGLLQTGRLVYAIIQPITRFISSGNLYGNLFLISVLYTLGNSVIAIFGGIYAFRRKNWNLALFGAVAACVTFAVLSLALFYPGFDVNLHLIVGLPIGITAIILLFLSKKQFSG